MATEKADLSEITDEELMESVLADEPEGEAEAEPNEEPEEQKADEEEPEASAEGAEEEASEETSPEEPTQEAEADKSAAIPAWRLREESEAKRAAEDARRTLEQQNAQLQAQLQALQQPAPKQDPIDPYEDPQGYHRQQQDTFDQRLLNERLNMSESMARMVHGDETVDQALQWVGTLPAHEKQAILNSRNPYGDLVARKKQVDTLAEIGTDPKAYRERILAEAKKDPEFVKAVLADAKTEAEHRPESSTVKLPPSLNKQARAANAKADAGDSLPQSDKELFSDAMRWDPKA